MRKFLISLSDYYFFSLYIDQNVKNMLSDLKQSFESFTKKKKIDVII